TATIGVPLGAAALPSPQLLLTPTHGLRAADVRVGGQPQKPTEINGQLVVALPVITPGSTLTVDVRARVSFRAALGLENLRAELRQDPMPLASAAAQVRFTADETRIVPITPGILVKIDWGVRVPEPEPPRPRPAPPSTALPELRLTDAGGLVYQLVGQSEPGARVGVNGKPVKVDKSGAW